MNDHESPSHPLGLSCVRGRTRYLRMMTAAQWLPQEPRRAILPPALLIEAPISVGLVMTASRQLGRDDLFEKLDRACWDAHTAACDVLRGELVKIGGPGTDGTYHEAIGGADLDTLPTHAELRPHSHLYPREIDVPGHHPLRQTINTVISDIGNTVQLAYKTALYRAVTEQGLATQGPLGPMGWELSAAAQPAAQRVREWCAPDIEDRLQLAPVDLLDDFRFARAGYTKRF